LKSLTSSVDDQLPCLATNGDGSNVGHILVGHSAGADEAVALRLVIVDLLDVRFWTCFTTRVVGSARGLMGEAETTAAAAATRAMGALKSMLVMADVEEIDDGCVDVLSYPEATSCLYMCFKPWDEYR
jgi:hypothetical protein